MKNKIDTMKNHKAEVAAAAATILAGPEAGAIVLAIGKGLGHRKSGGLKSRESGSKSYMITEQKTIRKEDRLPKRTEDNNSDSAKILKGGYLGYLGLGDSTAARLNRKAHRKFINPPPPGTPLLVALGALGQEIVEHTGIYLGNGMVAELRGDGKLIEIPMTEFLHGSLHEESINPRVGKDVFAACDEATRKPVGTQDCVENGKRFISEIGEVKYDAKLNNCHMFTNSCVVGQLEKPRTIPDMLLRGIYTIRRLTNDLSRELNGGAPIEWYPVRSKAEFAYR